MKYFLKEKKYYVCLDIKENRISGHNALYDKTISPNYKFFFDLKNSIKCIDNKRRPSYFSIPKIIPVEN